MATNLGAILARLGLVPATAGPAEQPAPTVTPDCAPWCGGVGKRRVGGPVTEGVTDRVVPYLELMRSIRYEFCVCVAGRKARALHERAMAALEAQAEQREADRLWDAAELPAKLRRYGLDDYPALGAMVAKLRRWQTVSRSAGANLLLYGDIGTYKTSLGAALLREHLADRGSGLFLPTGDFLGRIRSSYTSGATADDQAASEWTLIRAATAPGLVLLDDVPAGLSEWARGILFRLTNARDLQERPTIMTSNEDLAGLEATLGKRTFDRFRGGAADPATGEQFMIRMAGTSQRGLRAVPLPGRPS